MTVPGHDCPECDARLTAAGCPRCGWTDRVATPSAKCVDCREPCRLTQLTAGEDQRRRCASCHVAFLKQRAAAEGDPEVERCKREVARLLNDADERWATKR